MEYWAGYPKNNNRKNSSHKLIALVKLGVESTKNLFIYYNL